MSPIVFIGNAATTFSLLAAIVGVVLSYQGYLNQASHWICHARKLGYFIFGAMSLAILSMVYALLVNDFGVSYVAQVGAIETPRFYAMISLWSSLEGSILLWGWILSAYVALVFCVYRNRFEEVMPFVYIVLFGIIIFFMVVLIFPANPFLPVSPVPANGPGPNPLLQNHWLMALHPPFLYLGFVGFSIPFAFAVASQLTGKLTQEWVGIMRGWVLMAWLFLSLAILFGAWWSYAVLGWGGYWAWDPVENASLMPWLTATAFLHSVVVQERRQMLKRWNLALISMTFMLTILGTFLTRSGILQSVHSFTQSDIGHYFLFFLGVVLVLSVALLVWKSQAFKSEGKLDDPLSRETFFLFNNLLFVLFCFVVLLGTLYPLIAEAIRGAKLTVGEPFFNQMTIPIMLAIIFLMGIGSIVPWVKTDRKNLLKNLRLPLLMMLAAPALSYFFGIQKPLVLVTIALVAFTFTVMKYESVKVFWFFWRKKNLSCFQAIKTFFQTNPRRYGGYVAHVGILVIALGVAFSSSYQIEKNAELQELKSFKIGKYDVELLKLLGREEPHRFEIMARMKVSIEGKEVATLYPQSNIYNMSRDPITSPAVYSTFLEDLYLVLMKVDPHKGSVVIRAMVTPLVSWIWGGGFFLLLGVFISVGRLRGGPPQ